MTIDGIEYILYRSTHLMSPDQCVYHIWNLQHNPRWISKYNPNTNMQETWVPIA